MGRQGWPAFKEEEATVNVETLQRMAVVVETYDPLCEDEWIQVGKGERGWTRGARQGGEHARRRDCEYRVREILDWITPVKDYPVESAEECI